MSQSIKVIDQQRQGIVAGEVKKQNGILTLFSIIELNGRYQQQRRTGTGCQ